MLKLEGVLPQDIVTLCNEYNQTRGTAERRLQQMHRLGLKLIARALVCLHSIAIKAELDSVPHKTEFLKEFSTTRFQ